MSVADLAGVVTGTIGALTGVGGLVIAVISERRSRHADAAAAAAGEEARRARAGADSLEVSLQRIADSFGADRIETNRLIEALRAAQDPANRIEPPILIVRKPAFNIEALNRDVYRLRNVGAVAATSVDISASGRPVGPTRGPDGTIDLAPMESTEPFVVPNTYGQPAPGEVAISCAELAGPVFVPLPKTS